MAPSLFSRNKPVSSETPIVLKQARETLKQYRHNLGLASLKYPEDSVLFRGSDIEKLYNIRANELTKMAERTDAERIAELTLFDMTLQAANKFLANTLKLKEVCDTLEDIGPNLNNSDDPVIQEAAKQVVPTAQKVHEDILSLAHDLLNKPSFHNTAKALDNDFDFLSLITRDTRHAVSSPADSQTIRPLIKNIKTLNDEAIMDALSKKLRYTLRGSLAALAGLCLVAAGALAIGTGVGLPIGLAMIGLGVSLSFVGLLAIRAGRKQEAQKSELQSHLEVLIKQTEKLVPPEKQQEEKKLQSDKRRKKVRFQDEEIIPRHAPVQRRHSG